MNSFGYKKIIEYFFFRNLLIISPIFFLTVKHWTNFILLVFLIGSINFLWKYNKRCNINQSLKWDWLISFVLAGPFIAVVIGQLLRAKLYAPNFDAPFRIALCIPIFLAIRRSWLECNSNKLIAVIWIESVIPIALLWTFFFRINWPTSWGVDLTTYFVDPLTFGSYCLLFSILSLIGLSFRWNEMAWRYKLLSICGSTCGLYLSLTSGSRTGWGNLPIFLLLWTILFLKPRFGSKITALIICTLLAILVGLATHESYLLGKFAQAMKEINEYNWNSMNPDTSVGMRISFYRMGYYYFTLRPFTGWGDLGWMELMNSPQLTVYASEFTRLSPKHGFHNEIITSTVRSGIWGLISSCMFYFIFTVKCSSIFLSTKDFQIKALSFTVLIFIMHLFVMGMTTEITNLVFLASFIGLSLAVLMGEQLKSKQ